LGFYGDKFLADLTLDALEPEFAGGFVRGPNFIEVQFLEVCRPTESWPPNERYKDGWVRGFEATVGLIFQPQSDLGPNTFSRLGFFKFNFRPK
jgi:hypothetical protein